MRNQLLIALQDPRATHVAGFRAWLRLGYCVKRGETSHIRVWAPCPPSKKKLQAWRDAGAVPTIGRGRTFASRRCSAQTQVEALPPPAEPAPLDPPYAELAGRQPGVGDRAAAAARRRAWLRRRLRSRSSRATAARATRRPSVLTINTAQAVNAQVDVLCHELAHVLVRVDRHDDDPTLGYAEEELVAESVAHLAVSFVGLDSSASAVPYLAGWAESAAPDTFEQIAELVDRLARRLENALGAERRSPARRRPHVNSHTAATGNGGARGCCERQDRAATGWGERPRPGGWCPGSVAGCPREGQSAAPASSGFAGAPGP